MYFVLAKNESPVGSRTSNNFPVFNQASGGRFSIGETRVPVSRYCYNI